MKSSIFFRPRVGKYYEVKGINGLKILILGESHYCKEGCEVCGINSNRNCSTFTNDVMVKYFNYLSSTEDHDGWMRTFTRFTNIFFGERLDAEAIMKFWDSVVFYNYVQSCTTESRTFPTDQQFEESKEAFIEVVNSVKPDLIIVWGDRLWKKLPSNGSWGDGMLGAKYERLYYFPICEREIPAYCIYHPSTSYFTYEYSKYFSEVLRIVKKPC